MHGFFTRHVTFGGLLRRAWLPIGLLIGCQNSAQPSAAPTASDADDTPGDERRVVRVDSALVSQGRVAVGEAVAFASAGQTVIPGEVSPAPDGEAEVGSLVAGRVASLDAVEGARVTKGQVLAWIDAPEIGSVRADLARSNAQLVAAQQRLERQLALQLQGATSQSAVDESRAAVQSAQADQQGARAKLGSVGVAGAGATGRLALRSPIDGVVVERHATLGGAVTPEATLFRVINPRTLRVKAQWSETLGTMPEVNTPVQLSPRANPSGTSPPPCEARVETHLGVINPLTRSVTLQIQPGANCPTFTAGGYVDARIMNANAAPHGSVQVPLEAVVDLRGLLTVFVALPEPGVFEARTVDAKPSLGDLVPIELGLAAGEKVAVKGVILLKGEALADVLGGE